MAKIISFQSMKSDLDFKTEKVNFSKNTVLFQEGDPGGDLYFLKKGLIEIYQVRDDEEISLTQIGPGEVIGSLTFLTEEKRFASARALSDVETEVVYKKNVTGLIKSIPTWLETVIKDFVLRIQNMNRKYRDARTLIREYDAKKRSRLNLSKQVANGISVMAYMMPTSDDRKPQATVELNFLCTRLAKILGQKEQAISQVLKVFEQVDLIKIQRKGSQKIISENDLLSLQSYVEYIEKTNILYERSNNQLLDSEDHRVLLGMSKIAKFLNYDPYTRIEMSLDRLEDCFSKVQAGSLKWGTVFKAEKLLVVEIDKSEKTKIIKFKPIEVARFIQYDIARQRFENSSIEFEEMNIQSSLAY